MESINGDMENANEDMNVDKTGNQESTKSIIEDVKENVTESTDSINKDMKDAFTRFIEKNRGMEECYPRGPIEKPVVGELSLVDFVLDLA